MKTFDIVLVTLLIGLIFHPTLPALLLIGFLLWLFWGES